MANAGWDERTVFLDALAKPPEQREAFLETACPDEAARDRIRTLLRHQAEAGDDFLKINTAPADAPMPTQIDEFRILHRIGEGGMGVVYLAEDTILGRRVALKLLARHMVGSEQALARFREEARSAARLNHPAIVPVFRFGRTGDGCYLVTELVEGRTLAELIAERRSLPASQAGSESRQWHRQCAEFIAVIADALDCAHRAGIVHRDVKPSNILLDHQRGPRLTDFGIAKHLTEESRDRPSEVVGTCHYMSPEQAAIADARVDHRSDIFSLGVVLYEMLALRRPFDGKTVHQVLKAVVESDPPRMRSVDRRVPVDLETICHKSMEKVPSDRYQTAAHVAADLRCHLAGDPILAAPPAMSRRVRRWVHRRRVFVLACLAIGLALMLSFILWREGQLRRARMAALSITTDPSPARVTAFQYVGLGIDLGPGEDLGLTPLSDRLLEPGVYRIRLHSVADRTEADTAVCLLNSGGVTAIHVRIQPRTPAAMENMVLVRDVGAPFDFADSLAPSVPSRRIDRVEPFWLDRFAVTNGQYRRFAEATGRASPPHWDRIGDWSKIENLPVVAVTWDDAQDYARWLGKRLPTAIEWECAGRYPDARLLPWGVQPRVRLPGLTVESMAKAGSAKWELGVEAYLQNVLPVDADPQPSALGLHHLYGNVHEFTENILLERTQAVWCRGGSWCDVPSIRDLRGHTFYPLDTRSMVTGFRCALSAEAQVNK